FPCCHPLIHPRHSRAESLRCAGMACLVETPRLAMDEEARLPRLLGRYVLLGHLASGGMGTVYLARQYGDLGFGRTVAVKCLHPALAEDPRFVADFLKEGRLAARIRHPNVIPTLDVIASGGELALVMEYVDCITLGTLKRKLWESGEGVPIPIAAAIMAQVL